MWSFGNNYLLLCKQIHIFEGPLPSCWKAVLLLALPILSVLLFDDFQQRGYAADSENDVGSRT